MSNSHPQNSDEAFPINSRSASNQKSKIKNQKFSLLVPALLEWFSTNARDLPWRRTSDPYAIWVSEIMLQQTQVKTVIPYWERWMRALPTIADLAAAAPETIHKLWEGLGYYTRVRNLQKAAQQILTQHNGQFPRDFDAILELPGIGRYTAGAISSIAFNQPHPILDGNVIRVLTRIFGITANPKDKTTNAHLWHLAHQLVTTAHTQRPSSIQHPASPNTQHATRNTRPTLNSVSTLNQSLMELGALICTPRQPQCLACPVQKLCEAHKTNRTHEIPNLAPRAASTERHFIAFVIQHRGHYLVRQRPAGQVNAHLWEFPNIEITSELGSPAELPESGGARPPRAQFDAPSRRTPDAATATASQKFSKHSDSSPSPREERVGRGPGRGAAYFQKFIGSTTMSKQSALSQFAQKHLDLRLTQFTELCTIRHTITRYRITLKVFHAILPKVPVRKDSKIKNQKSKIDWLTLDKLDSLAFTSAHRKILRQILSAFP